MSLTGVVNQFEVDARGRGRDDNVFVLRSVVTDQGLRTRSVCQTTPFAGRRITRIENNWSIGNTLLSRIYFDDRASNEGTNFAAGSLSLQFTFNTETTRSPVAFFTEASWDSANLQAGAIIMKQDLITVLIQL